MRTPAILVSVSTLLACSEDAVVSEQADSHADESDGSGGADSAAAASDSASPEAADTASVLPPACATWGTDTQVGVVKDDRLNEISGVAASWRNPDVLWVHEDHAGYNEIYALDILGNSLGKITLRLVINNDWEDIAVGPCGDARGADDEVDSGGSPEEAAESCIFLGEIGDNDGDRPTHAVYRIPEPEVSLAGGLDIHVKPDTFAFDWPEKVRNSEALLVTPDGVPVLFTKEYTGAFTDVFTFPTMDAAATTTLTQLGTLRTGDDDETGGAATTAADLWPDGSRLVLRTYSHLWEYVLPEGGLGDIANASRTAVPYAHERQGESVGYDRVRRGIWHLSEDPNPPIWLIPCAD